MLLQCVAEERFEIKKKNYYWPRLFVIMQVLLFLAVLMRCYQSVIEDGVRASLVLVTCYSLVSIAIHWLKEVRF